MSEVRLSEPLLAKLAGWIAMKQARALLAADRVLSSEWQPPSLHGTVQEGPTVYRAGLVIRSESDADNLCPCRDSRQRGLICAHSVAVGLHFLKSKAAQTEERKPDARQRVPTTPEKTSAARKVLRRAAAGE